MKKSLMFNGVLVAEYEDPGDVQQEILMTQAILKEKGLFREIPQPQAIFNQAYAFGSAANDLHNKLQAKGPHHFQAGPPFVVNAAFAIELYLKALAAKHGLSLRGHRLLKLYRALPPSALADIEAVLQKAAQQRKYVGTPDIEGSLSGLNDAFVKWRYSYEESTGTVDLAATMLVISALHAAWVTRPVAGQQIT